MVDLNSILKTGDNSDLNLHEFSIRKKCIIFENTCIQISNVSSLHLFSVKDNFPRWTIIAGLIGLMMTTSPIPLIGLLLIGISGFVIYQHNTKSANYLLQILTNHGYQYNIVSKNKEFASQALEIITDVINTDSISNFTFDMQNSVILDNIKNSVVNLQSEVGGDVSNSAN